MSPERAKVFVAEDDKDWLDIIRGTLEGAGHSVVLSASTRAEALAAAERLRELGVQVATVDGNLNDYESSGADGQALLAAIRTHAPEVKTVGMSGLTVRGVDVNVGKSNAHNLGEVVKKL